MSAGNIASGKLKDVECLFTWDVEIDYIADLKSISKTLHNRIKHCPHRCHATYYNILAFVSHLEKKTDRALEYLAKAEAVLREEKRDEADFLVTYSSFAWLYHHLGNLEEMETYLGKVRSIGEGRDITVEAEKGWSFIRLGPYKAGLHQRAKEYFEKALEAKPDSVSYNVGYAIVLSWLEENIKTDVELRPEDSLAAKQLQKALDLDANDDEIMLLLALSLQECNPSKSSELVYKALTKCADMPEISKYAATYFWREGPTEGSLKLLQKLTETFPNSYFLHDQMGLWHWSLAKLKKSEGLTENASQFKAAVTESIRHFKRSVELEPSITYIWARLAEVYAEDSQLYDAETIFTRLLSGDSLNDAERQNCHKKYGEFLMYNKKDHIKAMEQLKKAYEIRIEGRARQQVRERLLRLSRWRHCGIDILDFLSTVDNQDRQLTTSSTTEATLSGLGDNLKTKMTIN